MLRLLQALLVDVYGPDAYKTPRVWWLALLVGLVFSGVVFMVTRGTVKADDPRALPRIYSLLALGAFASSGDNPPNHSPFNRSP